MLSDFIAFMFIAGPLYTGVPDNFMGPLFHPKITADSNTGGAGTSNTTQTGLYNPTTAPAPAPAPATHARDTYLRPLAKHENSFLEQNNEIMRNEESRKSAIPPINSSYTDPSNQTDVNVEK